jgi:hypothetical protein
MAPYRLVVAVVPGNEVVAAVAAERVVVQGTEHVLDPADRAAVDRELFKVRERAG